MPSELGQANGLPAGALSPGPQFITGGLGAPTTTTRSPGTRAVWQNTLSGSAVDVATGVESGPFLWHSTPGDSLTAGFKWYFDTARVATIYGGSDQTTLDVRRGSNMAYAIAGSSNSNFGAVGTSASSRWGVSSSEAFISNDTSGGNIGLYTNGGSGIQRRLHISSSGAFTFSPANASGAAKNALLQEIAASGDIPLGIALSTLSTSSLSLIPSSDSGSTSAKVSILAFNGSAFRSVVETANVSSGEPNLVLAKNSDSKVGVGLTTPIQKMDVVVGSGTGTRTDPGFRIQDGASAGTEMNLKFGLNIAGSYSYIQSTLEGTNHRPLILNIALCPNAGNVIIGDTTGLSASALDANGLVRFRGGIVESGVTRRTSGSSYTALTSDAVIVFASGSSGTCTLTASPTTGHRVTLKNLSGGTITVSPAAGTIDGAASYNLLTGAAVELRYDGTEWVII